jgi:GNAT superfamily N-acetyltransferase
LFKINVAYRPATEGDPEFAREAHHLASREVSEAQFGPWDETAQDRFFASDWRDAAHEIVLADGVPCGYVCIEDRAQDLHVREIVIHPAFQRRGIGRSYRVVYRTRTSRRLCAAIAKASEAGEAGDCRTTATAQEMPKGARAPRIPWAFATRQPRLGSAHAKRTPSTSTSLNATGNRSCCIRVGSEDTCK